MTRKRGAPASRLDAIMDAKPRRPKKRAQAAQETPEKQRGTFYVDLALLEGMRNAADFLSGPPTRATLNGLVSEALRRELVRLERKHNGGEPFPDRRTR